MHGIMLKRLGHNVRILEQASSSDREEQASGIAIGPDMADFFRRHDRSGEAFAIRCSGFQRFCGDLQRREFRPLPLKVTSWKMLYYRLRANFDGFESNFCRKAPAAEAADGTAVYDLKKRVNSVSCKDKMMTLTVNDLANGSSESIHADLVVAADGASSTARQSMSQDASRPYSGYVLWRGTVPEADVSDDTRAFFGLQTTHYVLRSGYVVMCDPLCQCFHRFLITVLGT